MSLDAPRFSLAYFLTRVFPCPLNLPRLGCAGGSGGDYSEFLESATSSHPLFLEHAVLCEAPLTHCAVCYWPKPLQALVFS